MPLDSFAAATVATNIVTALAIPPPGNVAAITAWTAIVRKIFDGIVANAEVNAANVNGAVPTPMNVTGTPVTGKGGIT